MTTPPAKYIPAGCLVIPEAQISQHDEYRTLSDLPGWTWFVHPDDVPNVVPDGLSNGACLQPGVQSWLLKSETLEPFARLFNQRWIKLELGASSVSAQPGAIVINRGLRKVSLGKTRSIL